MGRVKELLLDNEQYTMSYFLIVGIIRNADEIIYTLRDLLNDKTYVVTENTDNNRVSKWLNNILKENGVHYPNPTYNLIIKHHLQELYFHGWINKKPETTKNIKIIKSDAVKTFFEYEMLEVEKLKLNELAAINSKLNNIDKSIVDLGDEY